MAEDDVRNDASVPASARLEREAILEARVGAKDPYADEMGGGGDEGIDGGEAGGDVGGTLATCVVPGVRSAVEGGDDGVSAGEDMDVTGDDEIGADSCGAVAATGEPWRLGIGDRASGYHTKAPIPPREGTSGGVSTSSSLYRIHRGRRRREGGGVMVPACQSWPCDCMDLDSSGR